MSLAKRRHKLGTRRLGRDPPVSLTGELKHSESAPSIPLLRDTVMLSLLPCIGIISFMTSKTTTLCTFSHRL